MQRLGTVRWFSDEKGYGRLRPTTAMLWFHHSAIRVDGGLLSNGVKTAGEATANAS